MRLGSLVELSSLGNKLKWASIFRGRLGVITWINPRHDWYRIKWMGTPAVQSVNSAFEMFSRAQIKHAKKR
jgi:hypothetical protein